MKKVILITIVAFFVRGLAIGQNDYKNRFQFTEGKEKFILQGGTNGDKGMYYAGLGYGKNGNDYDFMSIEVNGKVWEDKVSTTKGVEVLAGYNWAIVKGGSIAIRLGIYPLLGLEKQKPRFNGKSLLVFTGGGCGRLEFEVLLKNDNGFFVSANQKFSYIFDYDAWKGQYFFMAGFRFGI